MTRTYQSGFPTTEYPWDEKGDVQCTDCRSAIHTNTFVASHIDGTGFKGIKALASVAMLSEWQGTSCIKPAPHLMNPPMYSWILNRT